MKIYPAVFRRYRNATPIFTHYNLDTQELRGIEFSIPYIYYPEQNSDIEDVEDDSLSAVYSYLYGKLMSDTMLSATILVNGNTTIALSASEVYTLKASSNIAIKGGSYVNNQNFMTEYPQIGLHLTKFKSSFRFTGPGRILYDDGKIYFNDEWYDCPVSKSELVFDVKLNRDLYRTIVEHKDVPYGVIPTKNGLVYINKEGLKL